jgi:phage/plasmid-like protein (TIGR03299 family)
MAHNLYYNQQTQKHSFFSVKKKAWHGLGTLIADYPTSAEAIKFAGLDYTVEKRPLFSLDNDNFENFSDQHTVEPNISVPNYFANLRTDTQEVLGVVGKDYQIVQNRDAFSFFDSILDGNHGIKYETAGALSKGERIFITAKLPDYIRVGKEDLIEQYIFLTTSHDGYGSITAAFTPVRIVCQNTLNAALHTGQNSVKIRHTANAVERLKQAHQLMGITSKLALEMEELYNYWSKIRISDKEVHRLIAIAMAPGREVLTSVKDEKFHQLSSHYLNIVENVFEYAQSAASQQESTTKGTLFGAYNAVTGYFQNVRKFSGEESKLKSIMYGTGLQRAQTAFDLCQKIGNVGIVALN